MYKKNLMIKKRKICFLTLVKSNSIRLKNKNLYPFKGKPLIYWTIKKIKKISNNYFINTDSAEVIKIAKKNNVRIIKRSKKLLGDNIPARNIIKDSIKYMPKDTYGVITIQANSPNLNPEKLVKAMQVLQNTNIEDIYTLTSDGKVNGSFWAVTKKKIKKYNFSKNIHDHHAMQNEMWMIDDAIDIHFIDDLKKAEKIFSTKKLY